MGKWVRGVKGERGRRMCHSPEKTLLQEVCLTYIGIGVIGRIGPIFCSVVGGFQVFGLCHRGWGIFCYGLRGVGMQGEVEG